MTPSTAHVATHSPVRWQASQIRADSSAVKVAVLGPARSLEGFAGRAFSHAGLEAVYLRDFGGVVAAMRSTAFDALVIEDHEDHTGAWLSCLRLGSLPRVPVIVVGPGDSAGISRALQQGADDYAVIGDGADTLVHRILGRVQSRRGPSQATTLRVGPCTLHAPTQTLATQFGEVSLTAREFALAWTLFENIGRVVSMKTLSTEIWGRSSDIGKRTLEQHVYKLRRKLGGEVTGEPVGPRIQTVYGVGYRLQM